MNQKTPNFLGWRALILLRADRNCESIVGQLERLGLTTEVRWPADRVTAKDADVIFFDADIGYDGLFGWPTGHPPVPLIAVLGSEAPGRISWMLAQSPSAYLTKPIGSDGIYSALYIAHHNFLTQTEKNVGIARLRERLAKRGTVLKAALVLMKRLDIDEHAALSMLRGECMSRRMNLETLCAQVIDGKWLPPVLPKPRAGGLKPGRRIVSR
jgi:AmiR/NasT family two-component response regulator